MNNTLENSTGFMQAQDEFNRMDKVVAPTNAPGIDPRASINATGGNAMPVGQYPIPKAVPDAFKNRSMPSPDNTGNSKQAFGASSLNISTPQANTNIAVDNKQLANINQNPNSAGFGTRQAMGSSNLDFNRNKVAGRTYISKQKQRLENEPQHIDTSKQNLQNNNQLQMRDTMSQTIKETVRPARQKNKRDKKDFSLDMPSHASYQQVQRPNPYPYNFERPISTQRQDGVEKQYNTKKLVIFFAIVAICLVIIVVSIFGVAGAFRQAEASATVNQALSIAKTFDNNNANAINIVHIAKDSLVL
ncbi:MAG: hypothetical protein FWF56_00120 [Firmicutes bacterium]|nr:hypothetical protein [Bacillota bacterium]